MHLNELNQLLCASRGIDIDRHEKKGAVDLAVVGRRIAYYELTGLNPATLLEADLD